MDTIITFFNSQFISSMIGALLGAGVAVYVARLQNKQQLKQLNNEHELQREFFEKQEENERERIFLQYTIELAEHSYEILSDLRSAKNLFVDAVFELLKRFPNDINSDEDIDFKKYFNLLYGDYLLPKYNSIIKLRDMLLLTLVIDLINSLEGSGSFKSTHAIIEKLSKYTSWKPEEIEDLLEIALENTQVWHILNDQDIKKFYQYLIEKLGSINEGSTREKIEKIQQKFES